MNKEIDQVKEVVQRFDEILLTKASKMSVEDINERLSK